MKWWNWMPWSWFFQCWILNQLFKLSFTFIKRLFSFSSLSVMRVVSFMYLSLLIFHPAILVLACDSSSLAFHMMYSAYQLNKQGDNIQPWHTPFPILNQFVVPCLVLTVASWHESESRSVVSDSANLWTVACQFLCPWNLPGQNIGMCSCSLLQGIISTQGSNSGLLHCRQILYYLNHHRSPRILEWVACFFSSRSSWPRDWSWVVCIVGGFFITWVTKEALYQGSFLTCIQISPGDRYSHLFKNFPQSWSTICCD